jgi:hypothetical protein
MGANTPDGNLIHGSDLAGDVRKVFRVADRLHRM